MRSVQHATIALVALLLTAPAAAQTRTAMNGGDTSSTGTRRATLVVQGVRAEQGSPTIDGRLDEAVWASAEAVSGFVQMRPSPGEAASERTEARVLYDAGAVYVGMRMYDSDPTAIVAQLARRDASGIHSDWAHVLIDSYHDRRTGFRFSVNPRGVQKDVLHYDDFSEDVNWDAVWTVATRTDSLGWTAEFRIPLSQLRFSDDAEELVWGVNFSREVARRGEWAWWSPVLPSVGGIVSQAGELHGLSGLEAPRRLEILPYTVARVTRAPADAGNPFYDRNAGAGEIGADLRYGLSSNLTLSATINPDFGQVEADPAVVNLSGFESFFPEKRPFFMEGSNIFAFKIGTDDNSGESLFYSRRIGRSPQRSVSEDDGWVESPEATTILGAAKLSGKTASGWTIGFLDAVTNREEAQVAGPLGARRSEAVEPMTNYAVGSLSRDFRRGQSAIGILGTATHRRLEDGGDFDFLRSAAYTAGVTGRHRFADGTWETNGYLGGSYVQGSADAISRVQRAAGHYFQRPDAEHLAFDSARTSLGGIVASYWMGKMGGSKLRGGFGGHLRTPGLEVNDLGFQTEADQAQIFANLRYEQFEPMGPFRSWNLGINPFSMWNLGGERLHTQLGHWANFELHNFWNGGWWMGRQFGAVTTTALRGGPAMVKPGGFRYSNWLNSDRRKPFTLSLNTWGGVEDGTGKRDYGIGTGVSFRPSARANVSFHPNYNRNHNTWQYVGQPEAGGEPRYVMGMLDQRTLSLTTRINYTLSPALSVELYAQPFVSAGNYRDFKEVADPRAERFEDRFHLFSPAELAYDAEDDAYEVTRGDGRIEFDNPDFNVKQFRSNAVLRWEYRPGSTLFVVWSQGRSDFLADGSFDAGRDFGRLFGLDADFRAEPTNVLLIKLNYWLNM